MILLAALATLAIANPHMMARAASRTAGIDNDPNCNPGLKLRRKLAVGLDCSAGVDNASWKMTIDFAKHFVTRLLSKDADTDVAIVYFSDSERIIIRFTNDLRAILSALKTKRCNGGSQFPGGTQMKRLFQRLDGPANKMFLIVTDGNMRNIDRSDVLKDLGVTIFSVGVGNDVNKPNLEGMSTQPPQEFNHNVPDYDQLPIIAEKLIHKITGSLVRFSPSYAPTYGGVYIHVNVPTGCFHPDEVYCGIGTDEVPAHNHVELGDQKTSNEVIYCLSPVTTQLGLVDFSIILKKGTQVQRLPAQQPFEFIDPTPVKPEYFSLTVDPLTNQVTAEWEKFDNDPITLVDLVLQRIEYKGGRSTSADAVANRMLLQSPTHYSTEYMVARNVDVSTNGKHVWTGTAQDTIPRNFRGVEFLQIRQARSTVVTVPTPQPNHAVPYWTGFRDRNMHRGIEVEDDTGQVVSGPDHERCEAWYDEQQDNLGWLQEVKEVACPPNAYVAKLDNQFEADQSCCDSQLDGQCVIPSTKAWVRGCQNHHKGASHCVLSQPTEHGHRQQCCYAKSSNQPGYGLVEGPPAGGFPQMSSSLEGNHLNDVTPWVWCCADDSPDCKDYFYNLRPSRDSEGYNITGSGTGSGDPHFTTLDGLYYTVFGCGEFTLIQSNFTNATDAADSDIGIDLQGYFEPLRTKTLHITRTSALAGGFVCKNNTKERITVNVYYLDDPSGSNAIGVMVNNITVESDGRPKQKYQWKCNGKTHILAVVRRSSSNVVIQGPGLSLDVSAPPHGTLDYIVRVKDIYKQRVQGLFGGWDSSPDNDLRPYNSSAFLSPRSDVDTIYNRFSSTWRVKKKDSLFVYPAYDESSCKTYNPKNGFPPGWLTGEDAFSKEVQRLCGDNFACKVDALATKNLQVGNASLNFQREAEEHHFPGYSELRDVSKPTAWGFLKTPRHPLSYPEYVNWNLTLYKEEKGFLVGFENHIGFLHFETNPEDKVTIFTDACGKFIEAASFAGNLQKRSGRLEAAMPIYARTGPNTTVAFRSASPTGSSGFLLAYASDIPAKWPYSCSPRPTKTTTTKTSNPMWSWGIDLAGQLLGSLGLSGKTEEKPQWKVKVDMAKPERTSFITGFSGEIIQLDASGTNGFFMSPNHPNHYDNGTSVTYEIRAASPEEKVVIHFLRFATEPGRDILTLKDMGTGEVVTYSGYSRPRSMYLSKSNAVEVKFTSDSNSNVMTGFLAAFASYTVERS